MKVFAGKFLLLATVVMGCAISSTGRADSCAVSSVVGSCTARGGQMCVDFVGSSFTIDQIRKDCNGQVSSAPCRTAGVVGSCRIGSGNVATFQRIYSPFPADRVPMICQAAHGTLCGI